jgi:hypothetical protein
MTDQPIRLTFRGGGWVLVMTGIVLIAIVSWAVAPAIFRLSNMPPGDNQTIESYAFDLSNLQIDRELVVPSMRHRNMSPVVTNPTILTPEDIAQRNNSKRDPLVVSKDLVVGVEIRGQSRAYPLHFLHVHEIVNDTLGEIPIAIVWHWPSGHLAVFEREQDAYFANSGITANGGMLFYALQETVGSEQLYASMLEQSVTGTHDELTSVPHDVVSWKQWISEHPNTTALGPDMQLKKRYRKASPELYFRTEKIYFPTSPMPSSEINPKTPVIVVHVGGIDKVYSIPALLDAAGNDGQYYDQENMLTFKVQENPLSASVRTTLDKQVDSTRALWFAWFANHPESTLVSLP